MRIVINSETANLGENVIRLISVNGHTMPKIFCDSCDKEISNVKEAAIVYENFIENSQNIAVSYVHKNFVSDNCMTKAENSIRSKGGESGWLELGQHLSYLVSNVGMTATDIEKHLKI